MCCVLAGCDFFKHRGVALETALKVFREFNKQRKKAGEQVPPSADDVASFVINELVKMGKLKEEQVESVKSDYLLADAYFQCQLVVDVRLLKPEAPLAPTPQLYNHAVPLDQFQGLQRTQVALHIAKLVPQRPAHPACSEHDIAIGRASAATWQLFPFVCTAAGVAGVFFERDIHS
jgi:hypothetical protein